MHKFFGGMLETAKRDILFTVFDIIKNFSGSNDYMHAFITVLKTLQSHKCTYL